MILVDTSAWIAFFRGECEVAEKVDELLLENKVAICGPIFTEILRGFHSQKEREKILPLFEGCHFLKQPVDLWHDAGLCGFELRKKGKTVKTMDLLIACFAMAHAAPLLTLEKDFKSIQKAGFHLSLAR